MYNSESRKHRKKIARFASIANCAKTSENNAICYKTKMTKKGQITIPAEYRKKMGLGSSSVVSLELKDDKIVLEKPKDELEALFGAWKDLTDEDVKKMRARWKTIYDKTPL